MRGCIIGNRRRAQHVLDHAELGALLRTATNAGCQHYERVRSRRLHRECHTLRPRPQLLLAVGASELWRTKQSRIPRHRRADALKLSESQSPTGPVARYNPKHNTIARNVTHSHEVMSARCLRVDQPRRRMAKCDVETVALEHRHAYGRRSRRGSRRGRAGRPVRGTAGSRSDTREHARAEGFHLP